MRSISGDSAREVGIEEDAVVTDDRSYIQDNDRERERLREFINGLDDDALAAPANEYWKVAGV